MDASRLVECAKVPFHAGQLTGPTIDLAGSTQGDVVALRRLLAEPYPPIVAVPGGYAGRKWYAIRSEPDETLFLTHLRAQSYLALIFRHLQGKWTGPSSFGCVPNRVYGDEAPGTVFSAAPAPTSDRILLLGVAPHVPCGTDLTGARFHVEYGRSWIALSVSYPPPPPGAYTCPLPAMPPFALHLDQPIGKRKIYDDGSLRPVLITRSPLAINPAPTTSIPKTPVN